MRMQNAHKDFANKDKGPSRGWGENEQRLGSSTRGGGNHGAQHNHSLL